MENLSFKETILKYKYFIIVSLITLLALFLRIYHLDYNSLWGDEMATLVFVSGSLADIWNVMFTDPRPSPPLFYVLEHFMLYFGDSEFILRLLPAIFGVLSVPIIYLVGKIAINENAGVISATLLTVSQCHIQLSQDARTYTLTALLFLVALLFYQYALKTNKIRYWVLFSAFSALAFWSHFHVVFGIVAIYVHLFFTKLDIVNRRIRDFKYIILSVVLFTLFISPLLLVLLQVMGEASMSYGFGLFVVPHSYYSLLRWTVTSITLLNMIVVILYSILALVGLLALWKYNKNTSMLVFLLIAVPMALVFVATLLFDLHTAGTHILYILPIVLLAISGLVTFFAKKSTANKFVILCVVLILLSSLLYLPIYYTTMTKVDYRACADELTELTNDGDIILGAGDLFKYYYDGEKDNTIFMIANSTDSFENIKAENPNKSIYYITSIALSETKNLTEIAPSGSVYLDDIISKLSITSSDAWNTNDYEIRNWLRKNTEQRISYIYPGIYHPDCYVYKFT